MVSFALGHLWYSPALFGKQWMAETGITPDPEKMRVAMPKMMSMGFLSSIISAYALAFILNAGGFTSVGDGVKIAFVAWLGFMATIHYHGMLYGGTSRRLFMIQAGYDLVGLVLMGIILSIWR